MADKEINIPTLNINNEKVGFIQAVDNDGNAIGGGGIPGGATEAKQDIQITEAETINTKLDDTLQSLQAIINKIPLDSFGKIKVSQDFNIFESSLEYPEQSTLYWSTLTNGTATFSLDPLNAQGILNSTLPSDYAIRQTKQRFHYQKGKGQFAILTFSSLDDQAEKDIGYGDFDDIGLTTISDTLQNGVFFRMTDSDLFFKIHKNGFEAESVNQANWNVDKLDGTGPTGFVFEREATHIFAIGLEWLGVGSVLCGFFINAQFRLCHIFNHANNLAFDTVYTRTANLAPFYRIAGGPGDLQQICCSINSEGGQDPSGLTTEVETTGPVVVSGGTHEAVLGIRLKPDYFGVTTSILGFKTIVESSGDSNIRLLFNPTLTGSVTWVDVPNSPLQLAQNNGNLVVENGIPFPSNYVSSDNDAGGENFNNKLKLGKSLNEELDEIWLTAESLGGTEVYYGKIQYNALF